MDVPMDIDSAPPPYEPRPNSTVASAHAFQSIAHPTSKPTESIAEVREDSPIPKTEPKPEPDIDFEPIFEDRGEFEPKLESGTERDAEANSDEDYECIHSGYDIKDESRVSFPSYMSPFPPCLLIDISNEPC